MKKPSILDALKPQRYRKIPPMTIEGFFRQVPLRMANACRGALYGNLTLKFYKLEEGEGGGWRADSCGGCSYGDTIPEAIRAAFDHVIHYPSRRARLNPPTNINGPTRISYDYRAEDWRPQP
jgi:hypothetical protein